MVKITTKCSKCGGGTLQRGPCICAINAGSPNDLDVVDDREPLDDLSLPDDREVTPDRIIIFQNHPLFPIVHLLRETEAKMVRARAEADQWKAQALMWTKKAKNAGRKK